MPAHFLRKESREKPNKLSRRWTYRQLLVGQLWERWMNDYLIQLRSAHHAKPQDKNELKVGDIIHEPRCPKTLWKLGRIIEVIITHSRGVHIGRDTHVRSCDVKLAGGQVIRRSVQLLYLLQLFPWGGNLLNIFNSHHRSKTSSSSMCLVLLFVFVFHLFGICHEAFLSFTVMRTLSH